MKKYFIADNLFVIGTGLLDIIGTTQFEELMHMHHKNPCYPCFTPDKSMVFVIDNTGSMADDIFQVRQKSIEIVNSVLLLGSKAPSHFVLATFNDPCKSYLNS